jgi:hypothetical protein
MYLICRGRHPYQTPHYIKPEIGKLPKHVVENIPLVIYIPPPPDELASPIAIPKNVYSYPPKPSVPSPPSKRFKFLRQKSKSKEAKSGTKTAIERADSKDVTMTWEDNWEKAEYPFVRLEGNRAACVICLMDFEEPKRLTCLEEAKADETNEKEEIQAEEYDSTVQEVPVHNTSPRPAQLKLEDAGAGVQPLRLLECGHVFHVSLRTFILTQYASKPDDDTRKHAWTRGWWRYLAVVLFASGP